VVLGIFFATGGVCGITEMAPKQRAKIEMNNRFFMDSISLREGTETDGKDAANEEKTQVR
jgi:hypothetical protein